MNTPEISIEEQAEAFKAWKRGDKTQYWSSADGMWLDGPASIWPNTIIRRKPAPKLRPWKPEEVPVGSLLRFKANPENRVLITGVDQTKIYGAFTYTLHRGCFDRVLADYEHSTDNGKTWHPCGVEETV